MTTPAATVAPQVTVEQAARLMRRHRVGRLPVTLPFTGQLAGIVTRSDLHCVYRRPGGDIRVEIGAEVLTQVRGVDPRRLAVSVRDGVVSVSGRVEARSAIARLVRAVLAVEGVVGVDERIGFDLDDRYPAGHLLTVPVVKCDGTGTPRTVRPSRGRASVRRAASLWWPATR
jgi:CBS domain-containing protein